MWQAPGARRSAINRKVDSGGANLWNFRRMGYSLEISRIRGRAWGHCGQISRRALAGHLGVIQLQHVIEHF